jgi:hypothetical protein
MSSNNPKRFKEKEIKLEIGEVYKIDGEAYLIDSLSYLYVYAYKLDESGEPIGRVRMIGSIRKRKIEKVQ